MVPDPLFYQFLIVALILICLLIHVGLPDKPLPLPQPPLEPYKRRRTRSEELKPFPGLIHKPLCEACAQGAEGHAWAPPAFQQPQRPYPIPSCGACPAPAKAVRHHAPPGSGALRGARQAPQAKGDRRRRRTARGAGRKRAFGFPIRCCALFPREMLSTSFNATQVHSAHIAMAGVLEHLDP